MADISFQPIRGREEDLLLLPYRDGALYFAIDSGKMYLDARGKEKIPVGGAGNSGIYYANRPVSAADSAVDILTFELDDESGVEGDKLPNVDDLILNTPDGCFYRVVSVNYEAETVNATRLTVSGNGGGGAVVKKSIDLQVEKLASSSLINGKEQYVWFTASSAINLAGDPIDDTLNIEWRLEYTENGGASYIGYASGIFEVNHNERTRFEFGTKARQNSTSRLILTVSQLNNDATLERPVKFTTSDLSLEFAGSFSNLAYFNHTNIPVTVNQVGNMAKLLRYYWDDELVESVNLDGDSALTQSIDYALVLQDMGKEVAHGYHTIKVVMSQLINDELGLSTDPVECEIAVFNPQDADKPIIWLGDFSKEYYTYDDITIPFRVFDPQSTASAEVHLFRNNIEYDNVLNISNTNDFYPWEIIDAEENVQNMYSIKCKGTQRDIFLTVTPDITRPDFKIQKQQFLTLNFDAKGRSNSESQLRRASWSYNAGDSTIEGQFVNFNWYNNGWVQDSNKQTCLRISNGAQFTIPFPETKFANPDSVSQQSNSFEIQFRIRNVQDYSNLIKNITRYKNDSAFYTAFYNAETGKYNTQYTNYDAFLAWYLKNNYVEYQDPTTKETRAMEYDDLVFDHVTKQIALSNVVGGYYNGTTASVIGFCLGPQDAFFSNGTDTVSVDYVDGQLVNLSIVYSYTNNLMYIYINGVLTGVIKKSEDGAFTIDNAIRFNSDYCDIDLYKMRFYNTELNVNDVIMNYAFDMKDIDIYDQNKLAEENRAVQEYQLNYNNMIAYNNKHPNEPLMPYIIFDTTNSNNDDRLSYSKSTKVNIAVEFVNPSLELAYTSGELEALAKADGLFGNNATPEQKAEAVKQYYIHHCPSFVSDFAEMAVQGTSSEFYPRRNYKVKTKVAKLLPDGSKESKKTHIYLNRGPFADTYLNEDTREDTRQDYWYMDNYICGTNKWTLKIDFMESSGSYNMGFANLVKNGYSKHPLEDYNKAGAFQVEDTENSIIEYKETTEFEEGKVYWYKNHKGNWKNTAEDELKVVQTAEDFNLGPAGYADTYEVEKVLRNKTLENAIAESGDPNIGDYLNKWYVQDAAVAYKKYEIPDLGSYRTSVQGFRTMAFHKRSNGTVRYIGMYNMLIDKGSDECYGFVPDKTAPQSPLLKFLKNKKVAKKAECWEFENNSRTFCSFRDPMNRKDLSFDVWSLDDQGNKVPTKNAVGSAPVVADSFEYRYHDDADTLDYIYDPGKNGDKFEAAVEGKEPGESFDYIGATGAVVVFHGEGILINRTPAAGIADLMKVAVPNVIQVEY